VVVILSASLVLVFINKLPDFSLSSFFLFPISIIVIGALSFIIIMIRFWRTPHRELHCDIGDVVSPADGKVIYLKEFEAGNLPVVIKKGLKASITEITGTDLINQPVYLLGINMTPFDVHKNCAPIKGVVLLNQHIKGVFLSLKNPQAITRNERNTIVIKNNSNELFGVVQTASRLVRKIDSYIQENEEIYQGEWFGMIRFGSQVDVIIPSNYTILVSIGQQIYARKSIIARK
jgi:phosphatidylserine decarboxylase